MPNCSVTNICRCQECIATHPKGCVFSDYTAFKSHTQCNEHANRTSAKQAISDASQELFVTTLSEGAITFDSQARSSRPTEPINEIADRLSDITIKPGRSSSVHHGLSSTPPLTAEYSSPAAARSRRRSTRPPRWWRAARTASTRRIPTPSCTWDRSCAANSPTCR